MIAFVPKIEKDRLLFQDIFAGMIPYEYCPINNYFVIDYNINFFESEILPAIECMGIVGRVEELGELYTERKLLEIGVY